MWCSLPILCLLALASADVVIQNITPHTGPTTGNTRVLVRGTGLERLSSGTGFPKCKFGNDAKPVNGAYVKCTPEPYGIHDLEPETSDLTANCILCDEAAATHKASTVKLQVSLTGEFDDCDEGIDYMFYTPAKISKIEPQYGPKNGGTKITVTGENFLDVGEWLTCSVGTKSVPATFISSTEVICETPRSDVTRAAMPFRVSMNNQQTNHENTPYWYYPRPQIFKLTPDRGPLAGGNIVTIEGQDLDPFNDMLSQVNNHKHTIVRFGANYKAEATILSDTVIQVAAPPSMSITSVIVDITLNNANVNLNPQDWTDDALIYSYYSLADIFEIGPRQGWITGGTEIYASGNFYMGDADYQFEFGAGAAMVAGEYINEHKIRVYSPAVAEAGTVKLTMFADGEKFGKTVDYVYLDSPKITEIYPLSGPTFGQTQVSVTGKNFVRQGANQVMCKFGEAYTDATVLSSEEIVCDSPAVPAAIEDVPLTVTLEGQGGTPSEPAYFSYYNWPSLTGIEPKSATVDGETPITIIGDGFAQLPAIKQEVVCSFGTVEIPATSYNNTHTVCGKVDVAIESDAPITLALNGQQFDLPKWKMAVAAPDIGPKGGRGGPKGGFDFEPDADGNFPDADGNLPDADGNYPDADGNYPDANGNYPDTNGNYPDANGYYPDANGNYPDADGNYPDAEYLFDPNGAGGPLGLKVETPPAVTRFAPMQGPSTGNYSLEIFGTGFSTDSNSELYVRFLGTDGKNYGISKAYDIKPARASVKTPPAPAKTQVQIQVSTNGQDFVDVTNASLDPKDNVYSYYGAPKVESISPKFVPLKSDEERTLSLDGKDFRCFDDDCEGLKCKWETKPFPIITQAYLDSAKTMHCGIPKLASPDTVPVEVSLNGHDYTQDGHKFSFYDAFVLAVQPPLVSSAGGNDLSVLGYGFADTGEELMCRFGSVADPIKCNKKECITQAVFVSDKEVLCPTPSAEHMKYDNSGDGVGNEPIDVEVSVHGNQFTNNHVKFQYFDPPTLGDLSQNSATANGGTYLITDADFNWDEDSPIDMEALLEHKGDVKVKFAGKDDEKIVSGALITYPFHSADKPNAIACVSPEWPKAEESKVSYSLNGQDFVGGEKFHFTEKLAGASIEPKCGPMEGNTFVTVTGSGLKNKEGMHLKWGNECSPVEKGDKDDSVQGYSAPAVNSTSGGPVLVEVGYNSEMQEEGTDEVWTMYLDYTSDKLEFYYYKTPIIRSLFPRSGPNAGGNPIEIHGGNFIFHPEVGAWPRAKFGDKIVDCAFNSTVMITCTIPENEKVTGKTDLSISFNGQDWTLSDQQFIYYEKPEIEGIYPTTFSANGGGTLKVSGKGFTDEVNPGEFNCRFTGIKGDQRLPKIVPAKTYSETEILCSIPGGWDADVENIEFGLTFNGIDYTIFDQAVSLYKVDDMIPQSSPVGGSIAPITVYGSGFKEENPVLLFINDVEIKPDSIEDDRITFKPWKPQEGLENFAGTHEMELTINGVDFIKFPDGFTVYKQPIIASMDPAYGPASGKLGLKLLGGAFTAERGRFNQTYMVGDYEGYGKVLDDHTMEALSINDLGKPEEGTTVPVKVSLNGFDYSDSVFFMETYGILETNPKGGPYVGGTEIFVSGYNFNEEYSAKCRFGIDENFEIVSAQVLSPNRLMCVSPTQFHLPMGTQLPLDVPIEVGFSLTDKYYWTRSDNKFRFYKTPKVDTISPIQVDIDQQEEIMITTKEINGFFPSTVGKDDNGDLNMMHSAVCKFGDFDLVPAILVEENVLKCLSPATGMSKEDDPSLRVDLSLALNGQDFVKIGRFLLYGNAEPEADPIDTATWAIYAGGIFICLLILAIILCCVLKNSKSKD